MKSCVGLAIICLTVVACTLQSGPATSEVSQDGVVVSLIHSSTTYQKTRYQIGEYLAYALRIENHTANAVEFGGIVFCDAELAFVPPNALHLIAPNGEDLMLPYQRTAISWDNCSPLQVEAGGRYGSTIPITEWIHAHQPGQYQFWAELVDEKGDVYRSNSVRFEILEAPSYKLSKSISLTLRLDDSVTTRLRKGPGLYLEAQFTNNTTQTLIFLRPQDGSFYNMVNPTYQITLMDTAGRGLRKPLRDAPVIPVYNRQTQFTLEPDASQSVAFELPRYSEMHRDETYFLQLSYIVWENVVGYGGVLDEPMGWDEDVFVGVLRSNVITITQK